MEYQYVIFQYRYDYYRMLAQEMKGNDNVIVVDGLVDTKINLLSRLFERRNVKQKKSDADKLWYPFIFNRKEKDKPFCFIVFAGYANFFKNGYEKYLRKKYPNCKIVCRFTDIIEKMPYKNFYYYKDSFDYLQTFDPEDAAKYGIDYYPDWYSKVGVPENDAIEDCDVLFVGRAKDRINYILQTFVKFKSLGLKCDFHIVDSRLEERKYEEEIDYCDYMSYSEVLQRIKRSKYILEIVQKDGIGETLRTMEAIFYNKKLITSNDFIASKEYYSPEKICVLPENNEIDEKFLTAGDIVFDDKYRDMYSMKTYLENLDARLATVDSEKSERGSSL